MKYLKIFILIGLIFAIVACSKHKPAPVKEHSRNVKDKISYSTSKIKKSQLKHVIVKKGDSLYSIGFDHNMDYKTLAQINNIKSPYVIHPGQKLSLVEKVKTQSKSKTTTKTSPQSSKKTNTNTIKITQKKPSTTHQSELPKSTKQPTKTITKTKSNPKKPIIKPIKSTQKIPTIATSSQWIWPVKGNILSSFSQSDSARKGIDIATQIATPVYASNHGTVVYSGDGLRGYGELIIIKHDNNLLSAYAHNSQRFVKEGENIKQGQEIAKTGKDVDGKSLLHFEIRKNGKPVNPVNYLPKK